MSRPSVFVSSAYYDMKHVQSSVDCFIETMGYQSVSSNKADTSFSLDVPFDRFLPREVTKADIYVLVIGGDSGFKAGVENKAGELFFEGYDAIIKKELESACSRNIPVYILIEVKVYAEYQTYLRNKTNENVEYAHADSVRIFQLIEEIFLSSNNSPFHTFDHVSDGMAWLREQWAGLFGELLQLRTTQEQLLALSRQIETLSVINTNLQRAMNSMGDQSTKDQVPELIQSEPQGANEAIQNEALKKNKSFRVLSDRNITIGQFRAALLAAETFSDFKDKLDELSSGADKIKPFLSVYHCSSEAKKSFNEARVVLGKAPYFPLQSNGQ